MQTLPPINIEKGGLGYFVNFVVCLKACGFQILYKRSGIQEAHVKVINFLVQMR